MEKVLARTEREGWNRLLYRRREEDSDSVTRRPRFESLEVVDMDSLSLSVVNLPLQVIGRDTTVSWNDEAEEKSVKEVPRWLSCNPIVAQDVLSSLAQLGDAREWMTFGPVSLPFFRSYDISLST